MRVVLDASAGVEIALWTDDGSRLARHILDADEIAVPDHFHLEYAAALGRMELRGDSPRPTQRLACTRAACRHRTEALRRRPVYSRRRENFGDLLERRPGSNRHGQFGRGVTASPERECL